MPEIAGHDTRQPPTETSYEHQMRVWERADERQLRNFEARISVGTAHVNVLGQFASLGITSIILANSASAGAVLAFLGSVWDTPTAIKIAPHAIYCVKAFAVGIFAAMLCAGFGYVSQFCYSEHDQTDMGAGKSTRWRRAGVVLHVIAFALGIAGIASFAIGAVSGIAALSAGDFAASVAP